MRKLLKKSMFGAEELLQTLETDKAIEDTNAVLEGTTVAATLEAGEVIEAQADAAKEKADAAAVSEEVPSAENAPEANTEDSTPTDGSDANTDKSEVAIDGAEKAAEPVPIPSDDEMVAETEELETKDKNIKEASEFASAVERFAVCLEGTLAYGGAKPGDIKFAMESLKSVGSAYGVKIPAFTCHSGESNSPSARKLNTVKAVETIREFAGRAWEAIKKFIADMFNWIKNIFSKKLATVENIYKDIEMLKKATDNFVDLSQPVEVQDSNAVECFYFTGAKSVFTVTDSITRMAEVEKILSESCVKAKNEVAKLIGMSIKNPEAKLNDRINVFDIDVGSLKPSKLLSGKWKKTPKVDGYNKRTYNAGGKEVEYEMSITPSMPGGTFFAAYLIDDGNLKIQDSISALRDSSIDMLIDPAYDTDVIANDYRLEYETTNTKINGVLDAFKKLNDSVKNSCLDLKNIEKELSVISDLLAAKNLAEQVRTKSDNEQADLCLNLLKAINSYYNKPMANFMNSYFSLAREVTKHVQTCLKLKSE